MAASVATILTGDALFAHAKPPVGGLAPLGSAAGVYHSATPIAKKKYVNRKKRTGTLRSSRFQRENDGAMAYWNIGSFLHRIETHCDS